MWQALVQKTDPRPGMLVIAVLKRSGRRKNDWALFGNHVFLYPQTLGQN
jgi:hypothetical protein